MAKRKPRSWFEQVKSIVSSPNKFFKKLKYKGGYQEPSKFALTVFVINGLLTVLFSYLLGSLYYGATLISSLLFGLILLPVVSYAGLFINAALVQLGMKIVEGKGKYEATFRTAAYSTVPLLLSWLVLDESVMTQLLLAENYIVPVLSGIVSLSLTVYGIYLQVVGLSYAHKVSKLRALGGIFIGAVILVSAVILLSIILSGFISPALTL